jgi:hypothetical protein
VWTVTRPSRFDDASRNFTRSILLVSPGLRPSSLVSAVTIPCSRAKYSELACILFTNMLFENMAMREISDKIITRKIFDPVDWPSKQIIIPIIERMCTSGDIFIPWRVKVRVKSNSEIILAFYQILASFVTVEHVSRI